jgi:type II restriction/modification system DNA methylase subunit YeeA
MLQQPQNPGGSQNSDVVRPLWNGIDVIRRHQDRWAVDFGATMSEQHAALYEAPFEHVLNRVRPVREKNNRAARKAYWWRHGEARPGLRSASKNLTRWLVTPETTKHRVFRWLPRSVDPEHSLVVIARDDDVSFGILQSRIHFWWVLARGNRLGVGNDLRYNATRTFDTFPFPEGLTPNIPAATYAADPRAIGIAAAARKLNELREAWLNPLDLVKRVPEVVPGFPDRILPVDDAAAEKLKKRTLTKLYNERPAWLDHAHKELDAAVAAAYGWPEDISEDDALARLFALNQERAAAGR